MGARSCWRPTTARSVGHRAGRPGSDERLFELSAAGAVGDRDGGRPAARLEGAADRRAGGRLGRPAGMVAGGARRCSRRSPTRPPQRSRTRARHCAGCSPRRSTTGSRTTCRRWPRCCACRRRSAGDEQAAKALREAVNRMLSIAAVHDLLTAARVRRPRLRRADRPAAGDARPGAGRPRRRLPARAGDPARPARHRACPRLLRALPERRRARRRGGRGDPGAARRRGRAGGGGRGRAGRCPGGATASA